MKKFFTAFLIFNFQFLILNSFAQQGEWTWMNGSNAQNQPGVYGTQGVFAAGNTPPALYEACEWTDLNGNFWLFGGADVAFNEYSDLWEFNPTINQWAWMKGPSTINQAGVYGTQGVSSPANNPGARAWGFPSWVDAAGNLWLFGGNGYDSSGTAANQSDLWKYDISTNEWTWMKGPNAALTPGIYGTQGVEAPANNPPPREEMSAAWTDNTNNLWFYGGAKTLLTIGMTLYDDLWKYDVATNNWAWMKGSSVTNVPATYGTLGVPDTVNQPGGRMPYGTWKDCAGDLWFFGGRTTMANWQNDLWKFQIASNSWIWMGGTNVPNDTVSVGTQCVQSVSNLPCARFENRARWSPCCNHFENFGGVRGTNNNANFYNDLWDYNVTTGVWTLMSGSITPNQAGNYGAITVSSPTNMPGSRSGALGWRDNNGNLWMFGGLNQGANHTNDMWRFVPDSSCVTCIAPNPTAIFTAGNSSVCPGTCVNFSNLSLNATSYLWTFAGANPNTSTDVNPQNICYNTPGNYNVSLMASNTTGSDTLTLNNYITVYPYPAPQGISQSGDTLFANGGAVSYQWYFAGNIITGATNYFYVATQSGDYNVVATDANGCEVEAAVFDVIAGLTPAFSKGEGVTAAPNPVTDKLILIGYQVTSKNVSIRIYNMLGEMVLAVSPLSFGEVSNGDSTGRGQGGEANVSQLPASMYYLEVSDGEKVFRTKFVKQ